MRPPEDRQRSPFTGWTRAHWEHVADRLLAGVRRRASPNHALIQTGRRIGSHGARADELEGFARSFLLGAFRLAGSDGSAPGEIAEWYSQGLRAGTSRRGREAWPRAGEVPQVTVEAASIALALAETRPWIWDRLDEATRGRVVEWLESTRAGWIPQNNWVLFPVLVETFLKSVGAPHSQDTIDHGLNFTDSCYRRDGWYTDGTRRSYDYYNAWAIHFSTLLWCRLDGDRADPSRAAVYRERARMYLQQYRHLFAANGAPVYHGRSLTYRFATTAPLWAGALVDATPLPPGETRRLASGALRYFVERGAIRDDLLTLGWHDAFPAMLQPYSGHGSPYWGGRGFLGLLLEPDHPVWTATEKPCAIEREDFCLAMPEPGFLVRGTRADGIVRLASHRSDHFPIPTSRPPPTGRLAVLRRPARRAGARWRALTGASHVRDDAHYAKLGYSSHTAPEQGPAADGLDLDSQLSLLDGEDNAARRLHLYEGQVVDRFGASVWYGDEAHWRERMETVTIALGAGEIRVHHVTTSTGRAVRDGGFAVAGPDPPETRAEARWSLVRRGDGLTSFAGALHGFVRAGVSRLEGANPFGRHSAAPYLVSGGAEGAERVHVSLVVLTAAPFDAEDALSEIAVEVDGRQVVVTCGDGECFYVHLVAPETVDRELGGVRIAGPVRLARVSSDGTSFTLAA